MPQDFVIYQDDKGLSCQNFNGKAYRLYPNEQYYSRGTKRMHVVVWSHFNGIVPKEHDIHHKNGDRFDNNINNLECIHYKKHGKEHMMDRMNKNPDFIKDFQKKGIAVAPLWHKSEEGINWHKAQAISTGFGLRTYGEKECEYCKKVFIKKNVTAKFCSNSCKSNHRRHTGIDNIERTCIACGSKFTVNKYSRTSRCFQHP